MHIFSYDFLRDDLLPAQLVTLATPISKSEICAILPDVSPTTVEAVFGELVRERRVKILGAVRATKYLRA